MTFDLICRKCGYRIENPLDSDYRFEDGSKRFPYCPICNTIMKHDVSGIAACGDYHHISDSLAIHPDQTAEHRKMFPNVGVLSDGRLEFNSVKIQERYANRCGFEKKAKRKKRVSKKQR